LNHTPADRNTKADIPSRKGHRTCGGINKGL
jgi:hypothetical protein